MAVKRASEKAKSGQVFGQPRRVPKMLRVGLYARVSTHDQQTLPLQDARHARVHSDAPLDHSHAGEGSRLRAFRTRTSAEADGSSATARDRYRTRLAS